MKRALAVSLVGILAVASAWYVWGTQQSMKGTGIPGPVDIIGTIYKIDEDGIYIHTEKIVGSITGKTPTWISDGSNVFVYSSNITHLKEGDKVRISSAIVKNKVTKEPTTGWTPEYREGALSFRTSYSIEKIAPAAEPEVLQVESIVLEHFLGSYSNRSEEGFFVIPGTLDEVREELRRIASGEQKPRSRFSTEEQLNFVVFRGVFRVYPTGWYWLRVDSVQRAGNTFTVRVTYIDKPGAVVGHSYKLLQSGITANPRAEAVFQKFSQPTAVIPIGTLPPGKYRAKLHVTRGSEETVPFSISFTVE